MLPALKFADSNNVSVGDKVLQVQDKPAAAPDAVEQDLESARAAGRRNVGLLGLGQSGQHWIALPIGQAGSPD